MTLHIPFDNSYARLPDRFFVRQAPVPVSQPRLLALNEPLAEELRLDPEALRTPEGIAVLAGNAVPEGADPLAQAYAGHQFGGWNPQLGDGRAILLGEVVDRQGQRRDIQLKGAGRTPFSRMGDGRAWVGPVLREFVVSEAMHVLGVPTTRALSAVATGETIRRERAYPGAVLARVAASHIRVGTFQYFYARNDMEALVALTEHVLSRHYPGVEGAMGLLRAVTERQARLVAQWMSLGFIHGVMNTDNMAVSGETIDYGPCAFMDAYHPDTVFSSIDSYGRYAYRQQPNVAAWNLAQLATALLPLMGNEAAIPEATEVVRGLATIYADEWTKRFAAKLGLSPEDPDVQPLATRLLDQMAATWADFTITFRALAEGTEVPELLAAQPEFSEWRKDWEAKDPDRAAMRRANPAIIPRNHRVEAMIQAAVAGDLGPLEELRAALSDPFEPDPRFDHLRAPPLEEEKVVQTFCGT
ncbi:Selenoprotein O and cysteine-containing-like protein [Rubellimicrobium mesophilum DSM 19309]|uniref:Protein nucleotidyltransferase YdiU n=1 Tax=Rubellimicrobium mesophilum DSM 19309 TaxID=442562 RepID=A0A017HJB1_9RHOB|nr:YdiU family protein [Rubellimicrobium mesophilum]EYD74441.1 Selenoprotein O and cysteine-containing-like protein [Rubellimicrobium mesophilum DSM 19309]